MWIGQGEPDRVGHPLGVQERQEVVGGARAVGADQHPPPGPDPGPCPGSWANAWRLTVMWSAAVFDPAFPARSWTANGSPVPSAPWSTNAHNGWNP